MDKVLQEEIIKALRERKATEPCPRCRGVEFDVLGDAWVPLAQERRASWLKSPLQVPVIVVACNTCGYMALHAKGILGFKKE